jgi:histidyl-tRNA synthetase
MDKSKLQTLKGFRDFLPKEEEKRQILIDKLTKAFKLFGFEPIETPALEYKEVLLGKYGEEADKLVYTFKDNGGRDVALRYDQTVPTARVLSTYQQELPMPFRRYQIQPVWRAEKPQQGRFRELLQCDADIYGTNSALADAEVIALSDYVYNMLGFKNYKIFVNDRNILYELMRFASIPDDSQLGTIAAIDKLDRKSQEEVENDLASLGLEEEKIKHLFHHLDEEEPTEALEKVMKMATKLGVDEEKLAFQARLARGLDYYTGTIFEVKIDEYKYGSVGGGGRYDQLIEKLSGNSIPAVGISFGFDRILEAMDELKLFGKDKRHSTLVSVFNDELIDKSANVVENLRENGVSAELYPDETKSLKKQLKYADKKGLKWLVVIGPDEVKNNKVILKDLETGHQEDVKLKDLPKKITSTEKITK